MVGGTKPEAAILRLLWALRTRRSRGGAARRDAPAFRLRSRSDSRRCARSSSMSPSARARHIPFAISSSAPLGAREIISAACSTSIGTSSRHCAGTPPPFRETTSRLTGVRYREKVLSDGQSRSFGRGPEIGRTQAPVRTTPGLFLCLHSYILISYAFATGGLPYRSKSMFIASARSAAWLVSRSAARMASCLRTTGS